MIANLSIKNIALIQELSVSFKKGLNILSGETGAGKSIIIDSINFVLGDRADRTLIRYGESAAKVEVVFTDIKNYDDVKAILKDADIDDDDDCVIISRTMTNDRSECRINRKIVTLSLLRNVVGLLVDTHSQNEHQSLLKVSNHLRILDAFNPKIQPILLKYREMLNDYNKISDKLSQFPSTEERSREVDVLSFQIDEINRVDWQEGEEEELKNKRNRFYNSQKIISAFRSASDYLSGDNGFASTNTIRNALSELNSITQYDEDAVSLVERLESAYLEIRDIADTVSGKTEIDDLLGIDLNALESRLDEIRLIKKKYGKTVDEVTAYRDNAKQRYDFLINAEMEIEHLSKQKREILQKVCDEAIRLHDIRTETAKVFCDRISANLTELGMKNAVFEIKFDFHADDVSGNLRANGADSVEFMLSPNLGEPVKPLAKIASGGEMSRFMLAIKSVIAQIDNVDTLIFDEIDTGISGVIAKVVAHKLYDISKSGQVIAITHLPQLASMGDANYLIEKQVVDGKTLTFLRELDEKAVLTEIMRLSGAVEKSQIGLSNAKELKAQADGYKRGE